MTSAVYYCILHVPSSPEHRASGIARRGSRGAGTSAGWLARRSLSRSPSSSSYSSPPRQCCSAAASRSPRRTSAHRHPPQLGKEMEGDFDLQVLTKSLLSSESELLTIAPCWRCGDDGGLSMPSFFKWSLWHLSAHGL